MKTELEAKWLDIKPEELRKKLTASGATLVHPEIFMRRKVFDYPDHRLQKKGGWIRVRDEGNKITMSYKELQHRRIDGTKEMNLTVDNFEHACELLNDIGLVTRAYQETRREAWKMGEAEITIDTWPWIPTFVEIETPDEASLRTTAEVLTLDWNQALHGSVETAYQKYYDFTEEEIDGWPAITFIPEPDWLVTKKR